MIFGLVGYGRFGKLWGSVLLPFGEVIVYDKAPIRECDPSSIKVGNLADVARADVIFMLMPISQLESACIALNQFVRPDTLILDCCSVKVYPAKIMQKIFSDEVQLIATHPLFGPDSVKKSGGLSSHKIVVCKVRSTQQKLDLVLNLFKQMGLTVFITTPEDHDKQMANSQGLVHFIGRGLAALEITEQDLATPDFQALLNINNMVVNDTWQLFLDMHQYNPFTKSIRAKLIQAFVNIDKEISNNESNH
jgi:prephenate dehydrogenase